MAAFHCVRCGASGAAAIREFAAANGRARSRWRKFIALVVCPMCGDDRGHAGILELGPGESLADLGSGALPLPGPGRDGRGEEKEDRRLPPGRAAADRVAFWLLRLRRGREAVTVRLLREARGFPEELAERMIRRGVFWVSPADRRRLRRDFPPDLEEILAPAVMEEGFLLPVFWFLPGGEGIALSALQVRYRTGPIRYRTIRIFRGWTPPAGLFLPGGEPAFPEDPEASWPFREDALRNGRLPPLLLVTEGWFKGAVAAEILGIPAVGFLGLPRKAAAVARRLRRLGVRRALLAPDQDVPPSPEVRRAFEMMARSLREAGIDAATLRWPSAWKGIDDALLAGWHPERPARVAIPAFYPVVQTAG